MWRNHRCVSPPPSVAIDAKQAIFLKHNQQRNQGILNSLDIYEETEEFISSWKDRIKALVGHRHFLILVKQNIFKGLLASFCVF